MLLLYTTAIRCLAAGYTFGKSTRNSLKGLGQEMEDLLEQAGPSLGESRVAALAKRLAGGLHQMSAGRANAHQGAWAERNVLLALPGAPQTFTAGAGTVIASASPVEAAHNQPVHVGVLRSSLEEVCDWECKVQTCSDGYIPSIELMQEVPGIAANGQAGRDLVEGHGL